MSNFITVAEARTEFEKRKKDIDDVDAIAGTFLQWCNYINRFAYRELTSVMPEQYISTQSYSTVAGTASYALPTTFQDINPQGTGLYEVNAAGDDTDYRLATTNFGSVLTGSYMTSTSIVFTPMPTGVATSKLRFIPLLADLTLETSSLIIPQRFSMHIMDALDACYNIWDEDQGAEVFNDERFIRTMEEMISHIKPDAQAVILPDMITSY